MRVLIIEGQNFIGRHIAKKFFEEGNEVHLLGDCSIKSDYIVHDIKVEDDEFESLLSKELFDIIIDASKINNEKKVFDINVKNIEKIVKLSKNNKVKKLVLLSSTDIYKDDLYIDEKSKIIPKSAYGISMLAYEEYYNIYKEIYSVDLRILRISNIYDFDLDNTDKELREIILGFFNEEKISNSLSENSKDYICIKDVVEGVYKASFRSGSYVYNLSYGKSYSGKEIFEILKVIEFSHKYSRRKDKNKFELSNNLAVKELGWKTNVCFEEGIYFLVNSLKSKEVKKNKRNNKILLFLIFNILLFPVMCFFCNKANTEYEIHILNLVMFLGVLISSILGVKEGLINGLFASAVLIFRVILGIYYNDANLERYIACMISNVIMYIATSLLIGIIIDRNKKEIKKVETKYNTMCDKFNFICKLYKED